MHMGIFFLLMFSLGLLHAIALMTGHSLQLFMAALQMLQSCESDRFALKLNLKFEHVFFSTWWIHSTYVLSFPPFQSGAPGPASWRVSREPADSYRAFLLSWDMKWVSVTNQLPTVICSLYDGCSSFISAAVVKQPWLQTAQGERVCCTHNSGYSPL